MDDFQCISLVESLYKLLAKVMAVKLINDLVDLAKKSKKVYLNFKVDFEKAYDSSDWSFLNYMLIKFGIQR